jgi:hypothetical protein
MKVLSKKYKKKMKSAKKRPVKRTLASMEAYLQLLEKQVN